MTTKKRNTTRRGPEKAPRFLIAHAIIIAACAFIAGATAAGTAMYALSLGFTGSAAIGAAVFAGFLAFTLDMVPVAFAPVWARAGWKLMIPGFALLAGFMLIGSALQVNAIVTYDKAQKAELIAEANAVYNAAIVKLDSITMPERECLCPQTRRADVVQYEAARKAPLLDKLTAAQKIEDLRETTLPVAEIGAAMMIYQIVAFLIRSIATAVTARIQAKNDAEYAAAQKQKAKERKAREKAKAPQGGGLRGNKARLRLVAANDV